MCWNNGKKVFSNFKKIYRISFTTLFFFSTHLNLSRDRAGKGNKRTTEREKKRRALAERKTQLTVDHMKKDNLIEKLKQLWTFLYNLEHERFDFEDVNDNQRYDVSQLRGRVTDYMAKQGKGIKQQKPKGLGAANVGAKLKALNTK